MAFVEISKEERDANRTQKIQDTFDFEPGWILKSGAMLMRHAAEINYCNMLAQHTSMSKAELGEFFLHLCKEKKKPSSELSRLVHQMIDEDSGHIDSLVNPFVGEILGKWRRPDADASAILRQQGTSRSTLDAQ